MAYGFSNKMHMTAFFLTLNEPRDWGRGRFSVPQATSPSLGYAWLDTGTMESLYEASEFVRSVERAQDLPVSVPEEIAWENGWIDTPALEAAAEAYGKSVYGGHLKQVAAGAINSKNNSYEE